MILFVSGRTDIPAYYAKWFYNRALAGFVDTRNPFNRNLVSRIYFTDVEAILFCTKRIRPLLDYLPKIEELYPSIQFVFHLTITPYHEDIEPLMAQYKKEMVEDILALSLKYGRERIFLRYDPILLNERYTIPYHEKAFAHLMNLCGDKIGYVVTSFVDIYKNTRRNMSVLKLREFTPDDYREIGQKFSLIAHTKNAEIFTCAEKNDLRAFGFDSGACLGIDYAKSVLGLSKGLNKQTTRPRTGCGCVKMADIGDYNCCPSRCLYCYANYDADSIGRNVAKHSDESTLLIGQLKDDDRIVKRSQ